jgi:Protein of unknown function (DUF4446)
VPIEPTALSWLAIAAGLLAVLAFSVALIALWGADRRVGRATVTPRPRRRSKRSASPDLTGAGVEELRSEVEALRIEVGDALRHLAVVRYDAFGDMGGHLSWSLALLDDSGNGMALTSIHGRSDSRTYAKNIREWTCDQQLSPEEAEAVAFARGDPVR